MTASIPEVWRDDEYSEAFLAWGIHSHAAMLAGAQDCVESGNAEGSWAIYKDAAKAAKVEHMLAYSWGEDPEMDGNPRESELEHWRVRPYEPNHAPWEEPITQLACDPDWELEIDCICCGTTGCKDCG